MRRHVMLLNFDPMRAVILKDRLLVIVPDGADSILVQLEKRVRGGITEMERSFLGSTTHGIDDDIGVSGHSRNGKKSRVRKFVSNVFETGIYNINQNNLQHNQNQDGSQGEENATQPGREDARPSTNHSESASDVDTEPTHIMDEYMDAAEQSEAEWNDLQGTEWIDLPFELQCTDAVLHTVSSLCKFRLCFLNFLVLSSSS